MNLFKQPEVQRIIGLLFGVLHHGFGNNANKAIPAKVETVVQTGDRFTQYIRDGETNRRINQP